MAQTVRICVPRVRHRDFSFELLGFDIILDRQLQPHLLEVNLSPACAERTPFLQRNLRDMTEELFAILCTSKPKNNNKLLRFLRKKVFREIDDEDALRFKRKLDQAEQDSKKAPVEGLRVGDWVLVENSPGTPESAIKDDLKVVGTKFDVKREIARERRIREHYYATLIQNFFQFLHKTKKLRNSV